MSPFDPDHEEGVVPEGLERLRGSDPFIVPDGFFERFPHQVQAMAVQRGSRKRSRRLSWAVATSLAAVAILFLVWLTTSKAPQDSFADLEMTAPGIEELELLIGDAALNDLLIESDPSINGMGTDLGADEIAAYLNEEHVDVLALINDL